MQFSAHPSRSRAALAAVAVAAVLGLAPGVASAATVSASGGTIVYSAASGEANQVTVAPWGMAVRVTDIGDKADGKRLKLTAGSGCTSLSKTESACTGVALSANLGDANDSFDGVLATTATTVWGGAGNDLIGTGLGADTLDGGPGTDLLIAGPGTDTVSYATSSQPVTAALGGSAGNGAAGENDSIAADVENLSGGSAGDTLTGDAASNVLSGGPGNDTLEARDEVVDVLECGEGTDGGHADEADTTGADCESVVTPDPVDDPDTGGGDPDTGTDDPDAGGDEPVTSDDDPPATDDDPGATDGDDPAEDAPANSVPPSIPAQTVGVSPSGVATVQIVCPAGSGGCSGTVAIELPNAPTTKRRTATAKVAVLARRRTHGKGTKIGQAKFTAAAGTKTTVPVKLSKRGRQRILRGRRSRGKITVTTRSADGQTTVTSQEVTLRLRRQAPRRVGRR